MAGQVTNTSSPRRGSTRPKSPSGLAVTPAKGEDLLASLRPGSGVSHASGNSVRSGGSNRSRGSTTHKAEAEEAQKQKELESLHEELEFQPRQKPQKHFERKAFCIYFTFLMIFLANTVLYKKHPQTHIRRLVSPSEGSSCGTHWE